MRSPLLPSPSTRATTAGSTKHIVPLGLCQNVLRGDFLEYRVIRAQNYRHPMRENEAICCFWPKGGMQIEFGELPAQYFRSKL